MDLKDRQHLYNGFGNGLARAFELAATPLVFGFLPIGLFYHAVFTAACSIVLWLLVKYAWPAHLDDA